MRPPHPKESMIETTKAILDTAWAILSWLADCSGMWVSLKNTSNYLVMAPFSVHQHITPDWRASGCRIKMMQLLHLNLAIAGNILGMRSSTRRDSHLHSDNKLDAILSRSLSSWYPPHSLVFNLCFCLLQQLAAAVRFWHCQIFLMLTSMHLDWKTIQSRYCHRFLDFWP